MSSIPQYDKTLSEEALKLAALVVVACGRVSTGKTPQTVAGSFGGEMLKITVEVVTA